VTNKINLVVMGTFNYPYGMAGTKRVQHVINALKQYSDVSIQVILQRQSSRDNILCGIHEGTPYQTVMGDLFRAKMVALLPLFYLKTIRVLKDVWRQNGTNIIYHYGPVSLDNLLPLYFSRRLGYKIVFDIVEDNDVAKSISSSFYHCAQVSCISVLSSIMPALASGFVAISSHLVNKYRTLCRGCIPVHYLPISVDMDCFPDKPFRMDQKTVSLFYGGSFGRKDGLPVLLDAFDRLAGIHQNVRLVLTGRGDKAAQQEFSDRLEMSPYKNWIEYKGYLDEKEYYSVLNDVDIPCMTRVDLAFAHAGFPFKLGEFLATGKPVIASRVSDVDSFLAHGHNAMLVQAGSSTEIFEAADYLINNPESAAAIGGRGREVASTYFDYRQRGTALLKFLKSL